MKTIHDPRYRELIKQLVALRESQGVTQVDLSGRLGKPQSYVAKIENFDRRLDVVELADWVLALGVSPNSVLDALTWWQN